MALFGRKSSGLGDGLKDPKELASVQPASLLAGEQEIRTVSRTRAEPCPQCAQFVEKRLATVLIERLHLAEGSL